MSSNTKGLFCGAVGCVENHFSHYCKCCQKSNSNHRFKDCPKQKIVKLCRVLTCNACAPTATHYCKTCNVHDVDHHSYFCPTLVICQPVQVSTRPVQISTQPVQVSTQPVQVSTASQPQKVTYISTVTLITLTCEILCCLRGVKGNDYGKIYSQGGEVDYGETFEQAAVRECFEECGVVINLNQLMRYSDKKTNNLHIVNFYVVVTDKSLFPVGGASPKHAWELKNCSNILGVPTNKNLAWVPLSRITAANETSNFMRNLQNLMKTLKIN